jgi:hypothetical protein
MERQGARETAADFSADGYTDSPLAGNKGFHNSVHVDAELHENRV